MEEEFYAVIKLISGEEIFSKVCPCEEDERTLLILDNPVTIETVNLKQFGLTGVKVNPWIKFTDDSMFIINIMNTIFNTITYHIFPKHIIHKVRTVG